MTDSLNDGMDPEPCASCKTFGTCRLCEGKGCAWCPECHPEVPEWD